MLASVEQAANSINSKYRVKTIDEAPRPIPPRIPEIRIEEAVEPSYCPASDTDELVGPDRDSVYGSGPPPSISPSQEEANRCHHCGHDQVDPAASPDGIPTHWLDKVLEQSIPLRRTSNGSQLADIKEEPVVEDQGKIESEDTHRKLYQLYHRHAMGNCSFAGSEDRQGTEVSDRHRRTLDPMRPCRGRLEDDDLERLLSNDEDPSWPTGSESGSISVPKRTSSVFPPVD